MALIEYIYFSIILYHHSYFTNLPYTGDALLHRAARSGNEEGALFLATHGASPNLANFKVNVSHKSISLFKYIYYVVHLLFQSLCEYHN